MDHENGLRRLKQLITEPEIKLEFLTYEAQLLENTTNERRYGSSEQSRRDRARIVEQLNRLALLTVNTSFNSLCMSGVASVDEHMATSILFLAADPSNASRLRLSEELREIQEKLQLAKLRRYFTLHQRMSVRPEDISQALLDTAPNIVHFSGHGTSMGQICAETKLGQIHPISTEALSALFGQFSTSIQCVILNACYSEIQATAIANNISYVIGMNDAIGDRAAISFAIGFYQAIGAGKSVEEAYKLGVIQIQLQNIPEHLKPVLIRKDKS